MGSHLIAHPLTMGRSPQVLTLATLDDLSRLALPYSAFILFHQPQDSSALVRRCPISTPYWPTFSPFFNTLCIY
jgi:hypothetical protein